MANQLTMPPPSLFPAVAGVPETLSAVLQQAMAKRPEDRFTTAEAMRVALVSARNELRPVAKSAQPVAPPIAAEAAKAAPVEAASLAPLEPLKPAQALTVRMDATPVRTSSAADVDTIFRPPHKEEELLGDTTPDPAAAVRAREPLVLAARSGPAAVPAPRTKRMPERHHGSAGRRHTWLFVAIGLVLTALLYLLVTKLR
jgi:hypothetical protein